MRDHEYAMHIWLNLDFKHFVGTINNVNFMLPCVEWNTLDISVNIAQERRELTLIDISIKVHI